VVRRRDEGERRRDLRVVGGPPRALELLGRRLLIELHGQAREVAEAGVVVAVGVTRGVDHRRERQHALVKRRALLVGEPIQRHRLPLGKGREEVARERRELGEGAVHRLVLSTQLVSVLCFQRRRVRGAAAWVAQRRGGVVRRRQT
jgi:hypothetical protein